MSRQMHMNTMWLRPFLLLALLFLLPIPGNGSDTRGETAAGGKEVPSPKAEPNLLNTSWTLTELNGRPAALGANRKEVHMLLSSEENKVMGFSGCNQFTGSYALNNENLHFGPMAATMMACVQGMELEQQFLAALAAVNRFSITGTSLLLYQDAEQVLGFKSVSMQ